MKRCVCYLTAIAVAFFFIGRAFPKSWLQADRWLFRCRSFEKNGRVYEKLGIRFWQNKLPDMSRVLPCLVPPKQLNGDYRDRLPEMIRETCAAELTHLLEAVAGLWCLHLWPGVGGVVMASLCILINLPFILIQRYNRPRFLRLLRRCGLASEETMHYETKESCCGL